jgi:hypothetical protein
LDNEFDWEEGLFEQEEEELYREVLKLWPIGEILQKELYFLPKIDCGMLQPKEKNEYLVSFYEHQLGEGTNSWWDNIYKHQGKKIIGWTIVTKE